VIIDHSYKINQLAELIQKAEAVAVFAGAGMGVDSGLEQFRGVNGMWTKTLKINNNKINYQKLMTHAAFE
jgi:NAD-dependent SIR2 family protein deacetylase